MPLHFNGLTKESIVQTSPVTVMNFITKGEKNVRLDTTVSKDDGASSRFRMSKMCDWSPPCSRSSPYDNKWPAFERKPSLLPLATFFYLPNRFQVRIRSHPANSETVISFERGNPTRAVMPFEQNVRLVTALSEQRLQARGMRNSPTFHAALSRARTCACVRSYRNLSVYRWL